MKTPQLFSHSAVESLLPEVLGDRFQELAFKLARKAGHRCEVTGYPYPAIKPQPGKKNPSTVLMMEVRDTDGNNQPMAPVAIKKRLKAEGLTPKTVRMVCPLVFWSRHVDLALKYGRGELIFAPWMTQGEAVTLFRTLMIADAQTGHDPDHPAYEQASEVIDAVALQMGNHGLLNEVLALPEDTEWDSEVWLKTLKQLTKRERRVYIDRFAKHLRLWPSKTSFSVLSGYWANNAHAPDAALNPDSHESRPSGNWVRRYYPIFTDSLDILTERNRAKAT